MLAVVIVLLGFVMVSPRKKHPEKDTPAIKPPLTKYVYYEN
jgi:hypothetical protein